jgi:Bacterial Ig-like domain (group 1).
LTYGDNPVLEVTLIDAEGNPVNNARIEVTNSLGNYKYNTDANGVINVPIKQKPGEHEFTFSYAGNKDYNPAYATKIVILNKMATEISVADVFMNYKEDADYEITVTDANGNPISGVTVNVNNGAKTLKYRTDSNGVATAPITLKPGTYTFTVSFDGNALYEPSSASSTVTVNKAEVTIDADDMECTYNDGSSFDAMLYDINANAISGVTVKFDNGVKVLEIPH